MPFSLHLFGQLRLLRSDGERSQEIRLARRKEQALLAYVAAQPELAHSREALMNLLWSNSSPESVANNLRVTLHRLRSVLNESHDDPAPLLHITRHHIRFQSSTHWCDVARLDELARVAQSHRHPFPELCPHCAAALAEAVSLYRGEFLDDIFVDDAPLFDEWLFVTREHRRLQMLDILHHLTGYHLAQGELSPAGHFAQRQIEIEPLAERAYGQWMAIQAAAGDRAGALQTFERCRQTLRRELGLEPNEEIRQLYTTLLQGERAPNSPLPLPSHQQSLAVTVDAPPLPHNLPGEITPLVGRTGEIASLTQRMAAADYRLFTIAGAGGVGKSRLALAVAHQMLSHQAQSRFRDGIFFVPLAPLEEAADIPLAILNALGLSPRVQSSSVEEQMLTLLQPRTLLLLLDNFEHLTDGVDLLLRILRAAPRVTLLVTSRLALQTQAEDLLVLTGLAVPGDDGGGGEYTEAVRLFVERAYRMDKSFRLSDENRADIFALCRLLEGIPLGIELAASWVHSHSSAHIRAALAHDLDFLSSELRDLPPRQRSLRALFDYSWQLLTQEEQAVLARLSIFRGGFDKDAAQTVAGASPIVLTRLQRHYLVRSDSAGRYDIHELLRMFAAQKLAHFPQTEQRVVDQHSQWYLSLIRSQQAGLLGPRSNELSTALYKDLDNLRLAWQTALAGRRFQRLQETLPGLTTFYKLRGMYEEMTRICAGAIAAIDAEEGEEREALRQGLGIRLAVAQADALEYRGMAAQAHEMACRTLAEAEAVGDTWAVVQAALIRGRCEMESDDMELSIAHMKSVLPLLHTEDDPSLAAELHLFLGISYTFINRHREAAEEYAASEAALARVENLPLTGQLQLYRGIDASLQGEIWPARSLLAAALAVGNQTHNNFLRVRGLNGVAFTEVRLGNFEGAREYSLEALHLSRQMGDPLIENYALHNLCTIYLYLGDLAEARRMGEASLALSAAHRLESGSGFAQLHLGYLLLAVGEVAQGKELLSLACAGMQQLGRTALTAEAAAGLAWACYRLGDMPGALAAAELTLSLLTDNSIGGFDEPARALWHLHQTLAGLGHPQAASILAQGKRWVQVMTDKIPDSAARHTFLTGHPFHRALLTAQAACVAP